MAFQVILSRKSLVFTILGLLALFVAQIATAQNCGCAADLCCSKYGYCGSDEDYCGEGCQGGPCTPSTTPAPTTGGTSVADIVTDDFFNGIINKATGANCPGKGFYTRQGFVDALSSYGGFGTSGSADDNKREIAAWFAHATHETGYFCFIEEDVSTRDTYCDTSQPQFPPCTPGKQYYGRGPLQLTWNYNYGPAGTDNGFNGLDSPETVASDPVVAFKTGLWYWMKNCHSVMAQGFGATIRVINSMECDGNAPDKVQARLDLYKDYCTQFNVSPGDNLSC